MLSNSHADAGVEGDGTVLSCYRHDLGMEDEGQAQPREHTKEA
jgi:hypothetical protein